MTTNYFSLERRDYLTGYEFGSKNYGVYAMLGFVHRFYKKKQLFLLISCFFPGLPIPAKEDLLSKERISTRGANSSPCNIYRSSTKSRNRSPHRRRRVLNIGCGGLRGGGGGANILLGVNCSEPCPQISAT